MNILTNQAKLNLFDAMIARMAKIEEEEKHHCSVMETGYCGICESWMDPAGGTHEANDSPEDVLRSYE